MSLQHDELLERMASTLRHQIGPAVGESYPKTQAFMASVVLEKVSKQLRLAPEHAAADAADLAALHTDLLAIASSGEPLPATVSAAVAAAGESTDALGPLVDVLYSERDTLGDNRFEALLGRVRMTLRARIDRAMEYAA